LEWYDNILSDTGFTLCQSSHVNTSHLTLICLSL
jgi:hypothetical protein